MTSDRQATKPARSGGYGSTKPAAFSENRVSRSPNGQFTESRSPGEDKRPDMARLQHSAPTRERTSTAIEGSKSGHSLRSEFLGDVSIYEPETGVLIVETKHERRRYIREMTMAQVVAKADYFRARRGFATDEELAEVLGVPCHMVDSWKHGVEVPNADESHILSHLAVVVQELEEFLDPDVIPDWLLTEHYTLAGRTPVDALRDGHLAEVLQTANATEHGAYI